MTLRAVTLWVLLLVFTRNINRVCAEPAAPIVSGTHCSAGLGHADSFTDFQLGDVSSRIRDAVRNDMTPFRGAEYIQQLPAKFEHRNFTCKLIVKPDGSVGEVKILHSSGSGEVDDKGLKFIKGAAPFWRSSAFRSKHLSEQSYLVEFPTLEVKPLDSSADW